MHVPSLSMLTTCRVIFFIISAGSFRICIKRKCLCTRRDEITSGARARLRGPVFTRIDLQTEMRRFSCAHSRRTRTGYLLPVGRIAPPLSARRSLERPRPNELGEETSERKPQIGISLCNITHASTCFFLPSLFRFKGIGKNASGRIGGNTAISPIISECLLISQ